MLPLFLLLVDFPPLLPRRPCSHPSISSPMILLTRMNEMQTNREGNKEAKNTQTRREIANDAVPHLVFFRSLSFSTP